MTDAEWEDTRDFISKWVTKDTPDTIRAKEDACMDKLKAQIDKHYKEMDYKQAVTWERIGEEIVAGGKVEILTDDEYEMLALLRSRGEANVKSIKAYLEKMFDLALPPTDQKPPGEACGVTPRDLNRSHKNSTGRTLPNSISETSSLAREDFAKSEK
jgi:hypothetical protein